MQGWTASPAWPRWREPPRRTSRAPAPTPRGRSAARPACAGSPWSGRGSPRTSPSTRPGSCTSSWRTRPATAPTRCPRCGAASWSPTSRRRERRSLLLHGIMDNRSVFTVFRRALKRRGFGVVHAVNYSLLTEDIRTAARRLHEHVDQVRERAGAERIHIVGHSLGGVIARYHVQRMGGDAAVDTLVTLGSPHGGTLAAHLLPTPLARQLRPGSDVIAELTEPAPGCRTRFLVVWSRMDQLVLPQRNGRLRHPDLEVEELEIRDVGHLALPVDPRTVHRVATS